MKKSDEIIAHILKPFNEKIQIHRCLKKIISLMPKNYQNFIQSIYYKNQALHIYVTHPAIKQEIFYNRKIIFSIIKTMHNHNICKEIDVKNIYTHYRYKKTPPPPKEIKLFLKEAKDFEIKSKNEEIKKIFEEIREIIRKKSWLKK